LKFISKKIAYLKKKNELGKMNKCGKDSDSEKDSYESIVDGYFRTGSSSPIYSTYVRNKKQGD